MNEFHQGFIIGLAVLAPNCVFHYFIFNSTLKILEEKLDELSIDIFDISRELKEERKSKDRMYQFVLDSTKK